MNIDINYKNKKRYNTAKYPIRQPVFIVWLIWLLSKIMLIGKKYKIEKINDINYKIIKETNSFACNITMSENFEKYGIGFCAKNKNDEIYNSELQEKFPDIEITIRNDAKCYGNSFISSQLCQCP